MCVLITARIIFPATTFYVPTTHILWATTKSWYHRYNCVESAQSELKANPNDESDTTAAWHSTSSKAAAIALISSSGDGGGTCLSVLFALYKQEHVVVCITRKVKQPENDMVLVLASKLTWLLCGWLKQT